MINAVGVYDIPEADYHADPLRHLGGSLSSTIARRLIPPSCPALAHHAMSVPVHKSSYDLGSCVHRLTLGTGPTIVEVGAPSWAARGAREIRDAARAEGQIPVLRKDLEVARAMRDAIYRDEAAATLLRLPGAAEQTLAWQEDGTWCRAMVDYHLTPGGGVSGCVDLKTTSSGLDYRSLQKSVLSYGYHIQDSWYRRGYQAVHGVHAEFFFIFVSVAPPHLVRVVQLTPRLQGLGDEACLQALGVWRDCRASQTWPGYSSPGNEILSIDAPSWAS